MAKVVRGTPSLNSVVRLKMHLHGRALDQHFGDSGSLLLFLRAGAVVPVSRFPDRVLHPHPVALSKAVYTVSVGSLLSLLIAPSSASQQSFGELRLEMGLFHLDLREGIFLSSSINKKKFLSKQC